MFPCRKVEPRNILSIRDERAAWEVGMERGAVLSAGGTRPAVRPADPDEDPPAAHLGGVRARRQVLAGAWEPSAVRFLLAMGLTVQKAFPWTERKVLEVSRVEPYATSVSRLLARRLVSRSCKSG